MAEGAAAGRRRSFGGIPGVVAALVLAFGLTADFAAPPRAETPGDVARGKAYTVAPPPNYLGKPYGNLATVLTDGRDGGGSFWNNGTALGWSWRTKVTVALDLEAPTAIGQVRVQAGAKRSGEAYFPSQIQAYGSMDGKSYAFLGETALLRDDESPDAATMRWFDIPFSPRIVRHVLVVVFARAGFIHLGEVEAIAAQAGAGLAPDLGSPEAVEAAAIARRRAAIAALSGPGPSGPSPTQRWALPLRDAPPAGTAAAGCAIARTDPWPDDPHQDMPVAPDAPLITLPGGRDYAAFRIANPTDAPLPLDVSGRQGGVAMPVSALAYVQALDYSWVPDVVTPYAGGALPPRSAMTVLVEAAGAGPGRAAAEVAISCGGAARTFAIPHLTVAPDDAVPPLHGTLWSYLHQEEHRPIAAALSCDADFLARYGEDSPVVHPGALLDTGGARPTELLSRYLRAYRNADRILLGMDVKTRPWAFKAMDDEAAARSLAAWWAWVREQARRAGARGELVLYPVDEPKPADVPLMERTRDLFRKAGIEAKLYATLEPPSARLFPWLDIAQLLRPVPPWRGGPAELQLYATQFDGKLQPVNGYYRQQGWKAWALGLTGVGVWSSWDGAGLADPASGWNPFNGRRELDFGMVYASPEGCGLPSRRLLAWRRGIEENRLLRLCDRRAAGAPGRRATEVKTAAASALPAAAARRALEQSVASCEP